MSCGDARPVGSVGHVQGFAGIVVADEPRAALIGRDALSAGGTAADAAIATAFALSATLPSQAGLGAGGVCLVYDHASRAVETLDFMPPDRATPVPAMVRGLYALHAKYGGGLRWEQLVAPAETIARLGNPVSRALAYRLAAWPSGEIDAATKTTFFHADGSPLREGDNLAQPALGATLSRIRANGAAALYDGTGVDRLAASLGSAAKDAPAAQDIRAFLPQWRQATATVRGGENIYYPTAQLAESGEMQLKGGSLFDGDDAGAKLKPFVDFFNSRNPPPQSASTGFAVIGRDGSAVVCDISLGHMFGNGHLAAESGIFPAAGKLPALQPILVVTSDATQFHLAVAAPPASAAVPAPQGLAAIACMGGAVGADSCRASSNPKGAGLVSRAGGE